MKPDGLEEIPLKVAPLQRLARWWQYLGFPVRAEKYLCFHCRAAERSEFKWGRGSPGWEHPQFHTHQSPGLLLPRQAQGVDVASRTLHSLVLYTLQLQLNIAQAAFKSAPHCSPCLGAGLWAMGVVIKYLFCVLGIQQNKSICCRREVYTSQ